MRSVLVDAEDRQLSSFCLLAAAQLDEQQLQQMGPFRALLESLLPWVNAGQAPDYGAEGEHENHEANGSEQHPAAEPRQEGDGDAGLGHEPGEG